VEQKKRPPGVAVISVGAIIFGVLDNIGPLLHIIMTAEGGNISFSLFGILLLVFGIASFTLKEWGRKGMIFASFLAIIQLALGMLEEHPTVTVIHLISIGIFGLIIYYFMRPSTKKWYANTNI
jgi:hypothetical protein